MLKYDIKNSALLTVHLYLRCYVFNWINFPLTHFWFIFSLRSPLSPVLSALIYLEQRGSSECSVVTLSCPKSYILPPPSPLQNHNNNISSISGLTRSDCEEELSKLLMWGVISWSMIGESEDDITNTAAPNLQLNSPSQSSTTSLTALIPPTTTILIHTH